MEGKIIKGIAGFYYVHAKDGNIYECRARGIFRKDNQKPLVGDNVEITVLDQEKAEGNLVKILPRKNCERRYRRDETRAGRHIFVILFPIEN